MAYHRKKAKSRQVPFPAKKKRLFHFVVIVVVCACFWLLLAPGSGLLSLLRTRSELHTLENEIALLQKDNAELQQEIEKIENDPQYLEDISRREYGLLKKNEKVYDFTGKPTSKEK